MGKRLLCVTLAIMSLVQYVSATSVICYHGTWSYYRTGNGKFVFSNVPTDLCTHYIYTFMGLDSSTSEVVSLDSWLDIDLGGITAAANLKVTNPDLKVLLAVGGWNAGSAEFSVMAADATKRATFIASALSWVQTYGLDGFDLDWEYPARRDSTNSADKENLSLLVQEFYEVFNPLGLLITAAVSVTPSSVDISYDVPVLSQYLDFINLMLYDFHGSWDTEAYHNAPLYSTSKLIGTEYADYSVNACVHGWIERGASPAKLALGVPFYGRTTVLSSSSNTAPGSASTSTGGAAGPYTATSGFLGYNEIVEKFNAGGWTTAWDDEQQVPYAYSGTTWLSYDDEDSIALKVKYAKSLGLGAIMIWSIETEDFLGLNGTQYPLLTTIQNTLGLSISSSSTTSTSTSTTSTTAASTTASTTSTTAATTSTAAASSATTASTTTTSTTTASSSVGSSSTSTLIADANSCTSTGYFGSSANSNIYFYCQLVNEKNIYCYFESWTIYRPGNGKFDIENIDTSLCTHIAFTFLGVEEDGSLNILDPWESDPDGLNGFQRLVNLKSQNSKLKVLASLGGWNEGSEKYSKVVADPTKRAVLVNAVLNFLGKYGFDGLDFDWEYPSRRDSDDPEDKPNFVLMLRELKTAFKPYGYLLSAAVNSAKRNIDTSYDVPALSEILDFINVMAYDFHGAFDDYVGHHTLLYSSEIDALYNNSDWNIDDGVKYWISSGADPAKMNFGIATYARTFTLADPSNASLYANITEGGLAGPYTRSLGVLGYNEICETYPNAEDIWDDVQKVPHLVIGDQWIGYDNEKSIGIKVDYALEKNLGGFMVWSFDTDDFTAI
ncbi:hypothetical protein D910_05492 [Dendroctonus ponderosae]|uniref:chitinase n=1 Tax=Dendroctonus ponderosae TaxID=77166 RepID=U4U6Y4_DENPD|nr:hypothetical protein D910_05492 [Dendroctonus ponderosae]